MKGHIKIRGDYETHKASIKTIDDIGRYSNKSFNYDSGSCRVDYFYDDYDTAELDYNLIDSSKPFVTLEEW